MNVLHGGYLGQISAEKITVAWRKVLRKRQALGKQRSDRRGGRDWGQEGKKRAKEMRDGGGEVDEG